MVCLRLLFSGAFLVSISVGGQEIPALIVVNNDGNATVCIRALTASHVIVRARSGAMGLWCVLSRVRVEIRARQVGWWVLSQFVADSRTECKFSGLQFFGSVYLYLPGDDESLVLRTTIYPPFPVRLSSLGL